MGVRRSGLATRRKACVRAYRERRVSVHEGEGRELEQEEGGEEEGEDDGIPRMHPLDRVVEGTDVPVGKERAHRDEHSTGAQGYGLSSGGDA